MTEPDTTEISSAELAAADPPVIEFDPEAERANAAAASAASRAAATPHRPGPAPRDPDAPVDPRKAMITALRDQFAADLDTGKYTPVAINLGSLADVALRQAASLPNVADYHPEDSPRERFYDHRTPELDPDEFYIPDGAAAGQVTTGAVPVPQSVAVRRTRGEHLGEAWDADVVEVAVRPAGAAEQDPAVTVELPLRAAQAFAFAVLSATWADPVDGP